MHEEKGFEKLVIRNTTQEAIEEFTDAIDWPDHLKEKYPDPNENPERALYDYFQVVKRELGNCGFPLPV